MKNILLIIYAVILFLACNSKNVDIIKVLDHRETIVDVVDKDIAINKLADSLKSLIQKSGEFCHWYVDNYEKLNQKEIIVFNDSLGYYEFNVDIADIFLEKIKKSGYVSNNLIEMYKERFYEYNQVLTSKQITNRDETFITNFTQQDAFFNEYEFTVPDKENIEEIKPESIEIYDDLIIVWFFPNIPVYLVQENNEWLVTFAG